MSEDNRVVYKIIFVLIILILGFYIAKFIKYNPDYVNEALKEVVVTDWTYTPWL